MVEDHFILSTLCCQAYKTLGISLHLSSENDLLKNLTIATAYYLVLLKEPKVVLLVNTHILNFMYFIFNPQCSVCFHPHPKIFTVLHIKYIL